MKKALLTITLLAATHVAYTQSKYNFSMSNGTYTGITGSTEIMPGNKFYDTLALGFDVELNGFRNDTLYINTYGTVSLGVPGSEADAFYAEMINGKQHYTITGAPGDRLVIIEFKDTKFGHDFSSSDFTNFQLWIYEKDGVVEMHYGNIVVNNPDFSYYYQNGGPAVGFRGQQLKGPPASPIADTGYVYLSGEPANGVIYRFAPKGLDVENTLRQREALNIYPNPGNGIITIASRHKNPEHYTVNVFDASGRHIARMVISSHQNQVDISNEQPGMYFINVAHNGQTIQSFTYLYQ